MPSYDDFLSALAMQESSGRAEIQNSLGYVGLYQMGESGLQDAGFYLKDPAATTRNSWTGMWTGNDGINSLADFEANPAAQTDALNALFAKNVGYIHNYGLDQYIGSQVALDDGTTIPITESGMLAAAHLGGIGGLKNFLESDGQINPNDSGKSISDYMQQFAGYDTPFNFGTTPDPANYAHFLNSSFDIPDSFGNQSNSFAQGLMPAGWDQMPSLDLPDLNANYPTLPNLPSLELPAAPVGNLFGAGFFSGD